MSRRPDSSAFSVGFRTTFPGLSVGIPVSDATALQCCGSWAFSILGSVVPWLLPCHLLNSHPHFLLLSSTLRGGTLCGSGFGSLQFLSLMLGADLSDAGWISLSGYLLPSFFP